MIVYSVTYQDGVRSKSGKWSGKPVVSIHTGNVAFVGRQLLLLREDGSVFCRRNKCTVFDDSVMPPRLFRDDYELKMLRKLKAKLPETFINFQGDIVNAKGEVIMEGPKT